MRVGIIGAGISGVSLASKLALLKKLGADIDITVLEATDRVGGTMDTAHINGFSVDSGTNGFLDSKPYTLETFREVGLSYKLVRSNDSARKRFIQRDGKLMRLPENASSFLSSKLLSAGAKVRLAGEFFIAKKKDDTDETLANFTKRRLGAEVLDYLIGPMVSGVFAGDPEKMSLRSSFPVIADLEREYGGLIRAMLFKKKKQSGPGGPGGALISYEGGMGVAVKELALKAKENGATFLLKSPVTAVKKIKGQFIVTSKSKKFIFDKLVICSPAYSASEYLKPLNTALAETLKSIPYAPIFVAGLGFKKEDMDNSIDGFGYLIPKKEKSEILGALFTSSMFPAQAPKDIKFLRVLSGGDLRHDIVKKTDKEVVEASIKSIKDVLGVKKEPFFIKTFKYEKAIPQYYVGHSEKVKTIESLCESIGNIYVGGNLLHGIGLNDCTKQSKIIAEHIRADLKIVKAPAITDDSGKKAVSEKSPKATVSKKATVKKSAKSSKPKAVKKASVSKATAKPSVKSVAKAKPATNAKSAVNAKPTVKAKQAIKAKPATKVKPVVKAKATTKVATKKVVKKATPKAKK